MKYEYIKEFISLIKQEEVITDIFEYIEFEIPKTSMDKNIMIIQDIEELSAGCGYLHLVEFRIIGKIDDTAIKLKKYSDILNDHIIWSHKFWYSDISLKSYTKVYLNADDRFEMILIYEIY